MPKRKTEYKWKENMACVATYKILEGDKFLDQFEDVDIPFDKAASVKLIELRYFPKTTKNSQIIELLSVEITRKFISYLVKTYTVQKQDKTANSAEIIEQIASVFQDSEKTIKDLAEVVDNHISFPDEG